MHQITIWEYLRSLEPKKTTPEPEVGAYVTAWGKVIDHIERPAYIGEKVIYDCSTRTHKWMRCGILEDYIPFEGYMRSIINVGTRQRILLTHYPGIEIHDWMPWDERWAQIVERRRACIREQKSTSEDG